MKVSLDKIALGITDDECHTAATSSISGAQTTNSSVGFAFSSARIFFANRYAAKLYSVAYTWRCDRTTDDARQTVGSPDAREVAPLWRVEI